MCYIHVYNVQFDSDEGNTIVRLIYLVKTNKSIGEQLLRVSLLIESLRFNTK